MVASVATATAHTAARNSGLILDHARGVGLNFVHQLHRLDDANSLAFLDRLADLDESLGVRG